MEGTSKLFFRFFQFCVHCTVIIDDGEWLIHIRVWVGGQGVGIIS